MKTLLCTVCLLFMTTTIVFSATKIINMTGCTLQLFNENNNNAPLTLNLTPTPQAQHLKTNQSYPSYTVEEQDIKVNIGSYNTWACDNYISVYHQTSLQDECIEVYVNILPTTPGESSVPGELLVRSCGSSPLSPLTPPVSPSKSSSPALPSLPSSPSSGLALPSQDEKTPLPSS